MRWLNSPRDKSAKRPWPGAFTLLRQGNQTARLKVLRAESLSGSGSEGQGTIERLESGQGFVVKCGQGLLKITQVQPEGKKPMSAWEFWQGARLKLGEK